MAMEMMGPGGGSKGVKKSSLVRDYQRRKGRLNIYTVLPPYTSV